MWTVTDRGDDVGLNASTDMSIGSFTPAANSLLVVLSASTDDGDITGITGHGTWSLVGTVFFTAENTDMDIWACRVGGSPSAAGLTISRTYTFSHAVHAIELSSSNGINGTTVADAFGTIGAVDERYNTGPLSTTLSAFARASNLTLGFGCAQTSYDGTSYSPSTGYTEVAEWAVGGGSYSNATVYIDSEDTSPSIEVDVVFVNSAFTAIEVKEAAGSSTGLSKIIQQMSDNGEISPKDVALATTLVATSQVKTRREFLAVLSAYGLIASGL